MSILSPMLPEARVLDLCAGSGALGLECLSRGAAECDFVESSSRVLTVLRRNLETLGGHPGARLHLDDALRFAGKLRAGQFDLALADPPYDSELARGLAELWLELPFATVLAVEHSSSLVLPAVGETRRYGSTSLTFFRLAP